MHVSIVRAVAVVALVSTAVACGKTSSSSPTSPTAGCSLTVPQTTIEVGFAGGPQSIFVSTGANCTFNVSAGQPFLTITSSSAPTGPGSVTFNVAENTGAARQGTVSVGSTTVTVNQAAGAPAIVFNQPTLPSATVGAAYAFQLVASGGQGTLRFSLQSGTFLPIGITLDTAGRLSGTPVAPGTSTFSVCVTDDTSRSTCRSLTLAVNPAGTTDSPILGMWAGNITLNTGCLPGLPRTVTWSGTFRRAANNNLELVASIPSVAVSNEVVPVTLSGTTLRFSITVDTRYDFTAELTPDFRSLTGTFTGGNCAPAPIVVTPSGTWNGTKQ